MIQPELPDDLLDLEAELLRRRRPESSPELRARVLAAVEGELADRVATSVTLRSWGVYAAGLAAAVLLVLNLTLGAVNDTNFLHRPAGTRDDTAALARQLQAVVPELSEKDALRWAALYRASGRIAAPAPQFIPSSLTSTGF